MLLQYWGIEHPKLYQLSCINQLCFARNHPNQCRLLLVRPTGDGKLLVIYGYGTLLCGVILMFIPFIALGSDQVQSIMSMVPKDSNIIAVHLDSLHLKEKKLHFLLFLLSMNKLNYRKMSLFLFMSPLTLSKTIWKTACNHSIDKKLISLFVVDECHNIPIDGRYF